MPKGRPGRVEITDTDNGFKRVAELLGELGSVTIGVQGKEAEKPHPSAPHLTIGQVAAIHELGLNVPKRSWLVSWIERNAERMRRETAAELEAVLAGKKTRNKALQELGFKWCAEVRDNIWTGKITPPLKPETIQRKGGETRPLVDTRSLVNHITYKVFLPNFKSIRDVAQRAVARGKK